MLSFNSCILSDHRALWIDLNVPALFQEKLNEVYVRPPQMTTKNLQWTKKARQLITKNLRELKVRTNIDQLLTNMHTNQRETQIAQLEK